MIDNNLFLFIEPKNSPSIDPVIDDITKKMAYQFREAKKGIQRLKNIKKEHFLRSDIRIRDSVIDLPWNEEYDFQLDSSYRGWHTCSCGACSDNCNYLIPAGEITNSLCVHYLAFHREEVPQQYIDEILSWNLFDFKDIILREHELKRPNKDREEK